RLDVQELRGIAAVGQLFRCLTCIALDAQRLAAERVERPVQNMRRYEAQGAEAVQAAGGSGGVVREGGVRRSPRCGSSGPACRRPAPWGGWPGTTSSTSAAWSAWATTFTTWRIRGAIPTTRWRAGRATTARTTWFTSPGSWPASG